jgi:hypothetical protein
LGIARGAAPGVAGRPASAAARWSPQAPHSGCHRPHRHWSARRRTPRSLLASDFGLVVPSGFTLPGSRWRTASGYPVHPRVTMPPRTAMGLPWRSGDIQPEIAHSTAVITPAATAQTAERGQRLCGQRCTPFPRPGSRMSAPGDGGPRHARTRPWNSCSSVGLRPAHGSRFPARPGDCPGSIEEANSTNGVGQIPRVIKCRRERSVRIVC